MLALVALLAALCWGAPAAAADSPWVNGADAPEFLYARGDTVDLQLGTDPAADKKRGEPVKGDLRLSIGNFQRKPTAVVYRKVADEKKPKTFSSGVVKEYVMDSVAVLAEAKVSVKVEGKRYVVEAAIPLAALGLKVTDGLALRGGETLRLGRFGIGNSISGPAYGLHGTMAELLVSRRVWTAEEIAAQYRDGRP